MNILILIILSITAAYLCLKWRFSYWSRIGFKQADPVIPFGNMIDFAMKRKSFGYVIWDIYKQTTEPFIGFYAFTNPVLLIRDVSLVKNILTADFEHFHDRGIYGNEKREPMSMNLLTQRGRKWKRLREKMTPLFSTGKLKNMFPTILAQVDNLEEYMELKLTEGNVFQMKEVIISLILNVIGSVFFGYDLDLINEPDHIFRQTHKNITHPSYLNSLRNFFQFMAPDLMDFFRIPRFRKGVKEFFMTNVETIMDYREKNCVRRNDFMQLMIDLYKSEQNGTDPDDKLTTTDIAGNGFIFYIAGTNTTATAASHCLYELARQPVLMKRVQKEIDEVLLNYDNKLCYDALQDMAYLELCIKETIRMYPGLPMLNRICTKDYVDSITGTVIKKGTPIVISLTGLQYDPKYFKDPYKFNPDRYIKGAELYHKDAYIPFGDGPRHCIAVRMGNLIAKITVAKLLYKYNFETLDDKPIEIRPQSVAFSIKGGLPMKVTKRLNKK